MRFSIIAFACGISISNSWHLPRPPITGVHSTQLQATFKATLTNSDADLRIVDKCLSRRAIAAWTLAVVTFGAGAASSWADEIGQETEAPTLITGETVEICTKRGPLGACLQTEFRTEENDNDKARKYFRDPSERVRQKQEVLRGSADESGNALINKLKQQSLDNKEKNDLAVARKTFENDQSATFGPFDRQVVIMNPDGKTFTLLQSPQAMRLKNAGFIKDRAFIKQPTEEDLENALQAEGEGLAGAILGAFGGGSSGS